MAQLTISGVEVRVRRDSFVEQPRVTQGQAIRAKDNTLLSSLNSFTEKRVIDCEISLFDETEEATFRTAAASGIPHIIAGDIVETEFTGYTTIGRVQYRKWNTDGTVLRRWMALHIEQE